MGSPWFRYTSAKMSLPCSPGYQHARQRSKGCKWQVASLMSMKLHATASQSSRSNSAPHKKPVHTPRRRSSAKRSRVSPSTQAMGYRTLFALQQLGIVSPDQMKSLDRDWAKYRMCNQLDACGQPKAHKPLDATGCAVDSATATASSARRRSVWLRCLSDWGSTSTHGADW